MNRYIILVLISMITTINLSAEVLVGKVVRVSDGDTFTILLANHKQVRVRMYGIDAPEIKGGQPYSQASRACLSEMIAGKMVEVYVHEYDRYGRALGTVSTKDIRDVNLEMLLAGMAWHYSYFDSTPDYRNAERRAKRIRIGLWNDPHPINPYNWRKGERPQIHSYVPRPAPRHRHRTPPHYAGHFH